MDGIEQAYYRRPEKVSQQHSFRVGVAQVNEARNAATLEKVF